MEVDSTKGERILVEPLKDQVCKNDLSQKGLACKVR